MNFNELKRILNQSKNIVFFGGAGTSTESGIQDFRSAGGLYSAELEGDYTPEDILSRDFFLENTEMFYKF
ncbi:NAD-dependent SIR2 family protein deacetylase [Paenibacillus sp. DS2015]